MLKAALVAVLLVSPVRVAAHPHLFFDAGLEFVVDGDFRLTEVQVTWAYDAYYTLLLFEDLGLDPDGDLILTDDEMARLREADRSWPEGYEGDLYGTADSTPLALLPPERFDLHLEGDRIVSTHVRPLAQPVDLRTALVGFKSYDPSYYALFDLALPVGIAGNGACRTEVVKADREGAKLRLEDALRALQSGEAEVQFPAVGEEFADEVRVTCGGS